MIDPELTLEEVAARLRMSPLTLRRFLRQIGFRAIKGGDTLLFTEADYIEIREARRQPPSRWDRGQGGVFDRGRTVMWPDRRPGNGRRVNSDVPRSKAEVEASLDTLRSGRVVFRAEAAAMQAENAALREARKQEAASWLLARLQRDRATGAPVRKGELLVEMRDQADYLSVTAAKEVWAQVIAAHPELGLTARGYNAAKITKSERERPGGSWGSSLKASGSVTVAFPER